ncbi:MAG: TetR/AcrR family transcriptional regulator, partial [Thermoleophilaceae bacterium]
VTPPLADGAVVERLLGAVTSATAERGYPQTTVIELATAGRASLTTFYAHFATKEDAFLAALDRARDRSVAVARDACDGVPDWRDGVREALDAVFALLASDPALARIVAVEAHAAGPRAIERRDVALIDFQALLEARAEPGDSLGSPLVFEATVGGVLALVYEQIRHRRAERMRELTPAAAYVVLSPLLGADKALTVALPGRA